MAPPRNGTAGSIGSLLGWPHRGVQGCAQASLHQAGLTASWARAATENGSKADTRWVAFGPEGPGPAGSAAEHAGLIVTTPRHTPGQVFDFGCQRFAKGELSAAAAPHVR